MRRDVIYYQIFKRFPSLLFTLLDHPPEQAQGYRFESIEVKEPDFRIDGVFLPPDNASPKIVYFAEFQAQRDDLLYDRLFSESMLYLRRNPEVYDDWFGVVIFTSRSVEPRNTHIHRSLLNGPQVRRIYLDELGDIDQQPIGISLLQLTTVSKRKMTTQAKQLLARVEEVEAMLGITLEETRFYQDVKEEGRTEGRTKERAEILARTVPMLLEAGFTVEQIAERLGVELEVVRRVAEPNS
jgi:predicted transposase/invertase (TIGR01784 family)